VLTAKGDHPPMEVLLNTYEDNQKFALEREPLSSRFATQCAANPINRFRAARPFVGGRLTAGNLTCTSHYRADESVSSETPEHPAYRAESHRMERPAIALCRSPGAISDCNEIEARRICCAADSQDFLPHRTPRTPFVIPPPERRVQVSVEERSRRLHAFEFGFALKTRWVTYDNGFPARQHQAYVNPF